MNGYLEAEKIDVQISKIFEQEHQQSSADVQWSNASLNEQAQRNTERKRELLKFLRTIETTCVLLQAEIINHAG